jgi:hypothetical protein
MPVVKRTKSGKFSVELTNIERGYVFNALSDFIENWPTSMSSKKLITEAEVMYQLNYSIINEIVMRKDFKLHWANSSKTIFTRPEAIAIMWMLRNHDSNTVLLTLKSQLHNKLI